VVTAELKTPDDTASAHCGDIEKKKYLNHPTESHGIALIGSFSLL